MTGRGWATNDNAEKRKCPRCGRRAALINGPASLLFCRWSRTGRCDFTPAEAARGRLVALGDTAPAWRRTELEAVIAGADCVATPCQPDRYGGDRG